MRLKTKIFLTYAFLILLLVSSFVILFRRNLIDQSRTNASETMRATAERSMKQLEEFIRHMEYVSEYLLSDMNVLSAMSTLSTIDGTSETGREFRDRALPLLRHSMYTYYITENFYRITYFNDKGDLMTSNFREKSVRDASEISPEMFPWLEKAKEERGRMVIGGAYRDPWTGDGDGIMVFGAGRAMPTLGYLEVQQDLGAMQDIFSLKSDTTSIIAFDGNGNILFTDIPGDIPPAYGEAAATLALMNSPEVLDLPMLDPGEIVIGYHSHVADIRLLLIQDSTSLQRAMANANRIAFLTAALLLAISFAFALVIANSLTLPLQDLRQKIEKTRLENLEQPIELDTTNNDVEALGKSYAALLSRLNEEIINTKSMSLLHVKAQLDSLQAQVNPHFLNNVLNVISSHAAENNDDEICEICDDLAALLQYATDTRTKTATLRDEVSYLEHYRNLLKKRYKQKIVFSMKILGSMKKEVVPRFLIQPLVENSIKHGFLHDSRTMRIHVRGWTLDGWWYVSVRDNGIGFHPRRISELKEIIADTRHKILTHMENIEFASSGIGFINTYARLLLYYKEEGNFHFSFENNPDGGTEVTVGAILGWEDDHEAERI